MNTYELLYKFISQRPGLDFRNYCSGYYDKAGPSAYRAEVRQISKDLNEARQLLRYCELNKIEPDFTAFSGRLSLTDGKLEYCTGQYFPTEYRKAVAAVCAAAIWSYWRESVNMPAPNSWRVIQWGNSWQSEPLGIHTACAVLETKGGREFGYIQEYINGLSPGDYLRRKARKEFGRAIASRWFN